MKFSRAFAALATALLLLSSCSGAVRSLEPEGEFLHDRGRGVSYYNAPSCYEPASVGDAYASFASGSSKIMLYAIPGLDPEHYLTEAYSGIGSLFVASDIVLPALEAFSADTIHLCVQSKTVWEFATIEDRAVVEEVVRIFSEGESVSYPAVTPAVDLRLKFSSAAHPSIYYNLIYVDYGDACYLYDRATRRCVEIGDLLAPYIDGVVSPVGDDTAGPAGQT